MPDVTSYSRRIARRQQFDRHPPDFLQALQHQRPRRFLNRLDADALVAEVNQGGDMVAAAVREGDPGVPVKAVRAPRGKDLPASIRQGQRLTTMTSGQESFPIAASLFKFAQHGKSGARMNEL
ncbi:MAG TPA: hypothetical protein PKA03_10380, partial [Tabrizicola sp.]|nr:hypothetical protein [Tabrizicola sp.]